MTVHFQLFSPGPSEQTEPEYFILNSSAWGALLGFTYDQQPVWAHHSPEVQSFAVPTLSRDTLYGMISLLKIRGQLPPGPVEILKVVPDMQITSDCVGASISACVAAGCRLWIHAGSLTENRIPT